MGVGEVATGRAVDNASAVEPDGGTLAGMDLARVFTRSDALAAGMSAAEIDWKVRSGEWLVLRRGVYLDVSQEASRDELAVRTAAAIARLGEDAAASHQTAAVLQNIALLGPRFNRVDLTRPAAMDRTPVALPGVRALRSALPAHHIGEIDGVRLTTPPRTVFDLARTSAFRAGVVSADSALHRSMTSVRELVGIADDCPRWPGRRRALAVIEFAEPLCESPLESVSRVLFRDSDLPMPRPQVVLGDADGAIGRVDFFWEEYGVIGEADGRVKYASILDDDPTLWAEKLRQERLENAGFIVVRWTWSELFNNPDAVVARIRRAFARSAALRTA